MWSIDEFRSQKSGVSALLLTMAAIGRRVYSGLTFVSDFYTGGVAAEADNCILLEIMIIVISFNDADLLYYLLFDAFARRLRVDLGSYLRLKNTVGKL